MNPINKEHYIKLKSIIQDKCRERLKQMLSKDTRWDVNEDLYYYTKSSGQYGLMTHGPRDKVKAIHLCVEADWLTGLEILLQSGADVNTTDHIVMFISYLNSVTLLVIFE